MKKSLLTLLSIILLCSCNAKGMGSASAETPAAEQSSAVQSQQVDTPVIAAPDFTLPDMDGKDLSLSDLRGKYVIIDFWGSWCGWCIKGMPKMKEYYTKYSGKLEILGIDCGDTPQQWKDAVRIHQLPWKHVFAGNNRSILQTYGVSGFPTKVVVDPEGNVAFAISGEDPRFYEALDKLLNPS